MNLSAHRSVAADREQNGLARPDTRSTCAALNTGVDGIAAECGGCATWHRRVYDASHPPLQPPSANQVALGMEVDDRVAASRPGCQIVPTPALDSLCGWLPAALY
jgi:hypothetical protein